MSQKTIHLEILSGPLDGHAVLLEGETEWAQIEGTPLSFPWDTELNTPQARLYPEGENWWLEASETTAHGTYCVNRVGRIEGKFQLNKGDLLKASETWLYVNHIR